MIHHDEWKTVISQAEFDRMMHWVNPARCCAALASALIETGSIAWMRVPYVIVGLFGVYLAWHLGRQWGGVVAAWMAGLAFALWPFKIYYDTMMREYTVLLTCTVGLLWLGERFRKRPGFRLLMALAALAILGASTHELAPMLFVIPVVYACVDFLCSIGVRKSAPSVDRRLMAWAGVRLIFLLGMLLIGVEMIRPGLIRNPVSTWVRNEAHPTQVESKQPHSDHRAELSAVALRPAVNRGVVMPTPSRALQVLAPRMRDAIREMSPRPFFDMGRHDERINFLMTGILPRARYR